MAKYQIIENWDTIAEIVTWSAYECDSNKPLPICFSLKSAEDCEAKLRKQLVVKPPRVVKSLEI